MVLILLSHILCLSVFRVPSSYVSSIVYYTLIEHVGVSKKQTSYVWNVIKVCFLVSDIGVMDFHRYFACV